MIIPTYCDKFRNKMNAKKKFSSQYNERISNKSAKSFREILPRLESMPQRFRIYFAIAQLADD